MRKRRAEELFLFVFELWLPSHLTLKSVSKYITIWLLNRFIYSYWHWVLNLRTHSPANWISWNCTHFSKVVSNLLYNLESKSQKHLEIAWILWCTWHHVSFKLSKIVSNKTSKNTKSEQKQKNMFFLFYFWLNVVFLILKLHKLAELAKLKDHIFDLIWHIYRFFWSHTFNALTKKFLEEYCHSNVKKIQLKGPTGATYNMILQICSALLWISRIEVIACDTKAKMSKSNR